MWVKTDGLVMEQVCVCVCVLCLGIYFNEMSSAECIIRHKIKKQFKHKSMWDLFVNYIVACQILSTVLLQVQ